jgi:hypothetical protein
MKQCKGCGLLLPAEAYNRCAQAPDGRHWRCKQCKASERTVRRVLNGLAVRDNDLTGEHFGRLTVLGPSIERCRGNIKWRCACSCGTETLVPTEQLTAGQVSCGCYRKEVLPRMARENGLRSSLRARTVPEKQCAACSRTLPRQAFWASADGLLHSNCKPCALAKMRKPAPKHKPPTTSRDERRSLVASGVKPCSGCLAVLPLTSFKPNARSMGGVGNVCMICEKARRRAIYERHRDDITDSYLRNHLNKRVFRSVPAGLLDAKRELLRLQRLIKQVKEASPRSKP